MTVIAPATASLVVFMQGSDSQLPGGFRSVAGIVHAAVGLSASVVVLAPEGSTFVVNIPHVSIAAPGLSNWSWPAASGNANS